MSEYNFSLEDYRFDLDDKNILMIRGWFRDDNPDHRKVEVVQDGQKLSYELEVKNGPQIRGKYLSYNAGINEELFLRVQLPSELHDKKRIDIYSVSSNGEQKEKVKSISMGRLIRRQELIEHYIEVVKSGDDSIHITGWAIAQGEVEFKVFSSGREIPNIELKRSFRRDVMELFPEAHKEYQAGFELVLPGCQWNHVRIMMATAYKKAEESVNIQSFAKKQTKNGQPSVIQKVIYNCKKIGLKETFHKCIKRIMNPSVEVTYERWRRKYDVTPEELARQREVHFSVEPMMSIAIPLYKTKEKFLRELIQTIQEQTYSNWELCLADGSGAEDNLSMLIGEYQSKDARIKYKLLDTNEGIAGNTNEAIAMSSGDFIVLADHDDLLAKNALYECVKAINDNKMVDVIYTDEDKVDMTGQQYFQPHFKSDMNIDLLCSMNYICHMFVFHRDILDKVGSFRGEYDGAQDHDFILRCVEQASCVYHIPKILYHWRCHQESTAQNPESKLYAFENGCKAIEAHYKRIGVPATVEQGEYYGLYRTNYHWKEQPLISIMIPNKDHVEDLKKCMESIDYKSTYRNYEYIIIENNSEEQKTFAYYDEIAARDNVQVVTYQGDFNFSKINNYGFQFAKGEYVLLLNNDTEIINEDCLWQMLGYCMREDVGIVGARLFFEDHTIQHAGVVIGFGGMAGHTFVGEPGESNGYFSRIICAQDYSAITAACMMVKHDIYEQVGGLTESYKVAFNDIDFCLKVRATGKLVVYNPYAMLTHFESKSRGLEDSQEKIERFNSEVERLCNDWEDIMTNGDPYYNPNLTLDKADFSLKQ